MPSECVTANLGPRFYRWLRVFDGLARVEMSSVVDQVNVNWTVTVIMMGTACPFSHVG
jgi:hypothetical protein